jgi:tRNA-specific 2-thiouridylase
VPDGDAAGFVERQMADEPRAGSIVDSSGRVLGQHAGLHRFTVGQRKGLGVATGVPLYVLKLEPATADIVVGPRDELGRSELVAADVNWISGTAPSSPRRITARIRHRHRDAPATVTASGADASVRFDEPQLAVAPGQAVVFYDEEEVLGGGWIASS